MPYLKTALLEERRGMCHIFMFCRQVSSQIDQFEFDLKRNSLVRTGIYEYTLHPINILATCLNGGALKIDIR